MAKERNSDTFMNITRYAETRLRRVRENASKEEHKSPTTKALVDLLIKGLNAYIKLDSQKLPENKNFKLDSLKNFEALLYEMTHPVDRSVFKIDLEEVVLYMTDALLVHTNNLHDVERECLVECVYLVYGYSMGSFATMQIRKKSPHIAGSAE